MKSEVLYQWPRKGLLNYLGVLVDRSAEHWTCDWKVTGLNLGLEGSLGVFPSLISAPVIWKRRKPEAPSQPYNSAGLLNYFCYYLKRVLDRSMCTENFLIKVVS